MTKEKYIVSGSAVSDRGVMFPYRETIEADAPLEAVRQAEGEVERITAGVGKLMGKHIKLVE